MKPKEVIKNFIGNYPWAADIYWLAGQGKYKLNSRFNMDTLEVRLPELVNQVKPFIAPIPGGKKVFLFASWHHWIMHAIVNGLALRGLNHDVTVGYLPYGDYDKPTRPFDLRYQDLYARKVLNNAFPLIKILPLLDIQPVRNLPEELDRALECLTVIDTQYILQREDIDKEGKTFQLRKNRNYEAARRSLAYFQKQRPDVVVVPNGMIQEYGAVYETAHYLGIRTVTYEFGEQDQRLWLSRELPVMFFDSFNEVWKTCENRKLDIQQQAWLENFLGARQHLSKGDNFVHLWQKVDREGGASSKLALGLDERPVVLLPTNVLGDTATLGRAIFTNSMSAWIQKVVPFFADKPQVQLVIRIHPAESRSVGPSIADVIHKVLPELPPHIHLVGPKEKVNTYDLMDIADLGLVYTTTAGMEMALRGIPVMVSGVAPYRNRGFTIDTYTWDEYFGKIIEMLPILRSYRLTSEQTDRAWNYAYAFFRDFTRPFPWTIEQTMLDLDKRPISYVLSSEGRQQYESTFQEMAGEPIIW